MNNLINDIKEHVSYRLENSVGVSGDELHFHLCNTDLYIVGTFKAKQWLGDHAFDAIKKIVEYEQENFGELHTDVSDPEKVANMLAYIVGDEILQGSETLNSAWEDGLTINQLKLIKSEIA
tara:strand:- start:1136 stop:1498 length:363 start_codon:yes stop_codon:yes gene_type:complete